MAVTITLYPLGKKKLLDGTIDLDSHAFKVALFNNIAVYNSAHDELADISANEIANGNGYTTGGQALSSITLNESGGTVTWDAADADWTASGAGLSAYKAAIYDDTVVGKPLLAFIDLDGLQNAVAGAHLKLIWNASGILTLT